MSHSRVRSGARRFLGALLVALLLGSGAATLTASPAAAVQEPRTTRSVTDGVTTYRITNGFDLDQYLYRASNPLDFAFDINPYNSLRTYQSGFPTPAHPLYAKEMILTVFALDVDEEQGEVDEVWFNGHLLGTLKGVDGQWSVNTFHVPGAWMKFGPTGSATVRNDVQVKIDVNAQGWAVEVAWGELAINPGPEPVVMVHGLNAAGDSDGDGYNDKWDTARGFYVDELPALGDRLAAPVLTDKGGVETDGALLSDAVDELLTDTGFNSVQLLAHSFGGLTSRRYAFDHLGRVRTLAMIATPNGGSESATDVCKVQRANGPIRYIDPVRWFKIGVAAALDAGHCDDETSKIYQLQQWYVRDVFNESVRDSDSVLPDRTTTNYYTIGGTGFHAANGVLNSQDDGQVELSSAFWLRPADEGIGGLGRNDDHPGRHHPWSVYNLNHDQLINRPSPLGDAFCLHYARINASTCPLAEEESAMASMASLPVGPPPATDVELVGAPASDVAAGQTITLDLGLGAYDQATVMLLSDQDPSTLSGSLDGTPLAVTDFLVQALSATVTSPTGQLQITNSGASTATVGVLVYAPADHHMTVEVDRTQALPDQPVEVVVRTGGSSATPIVRYSPASDSDAAGVDIAVAPLGGGVWSGSFVPTGSGAWIVNAWTTAPEVRDATAAVSVAANTARLTGDVVESTTDENGNGLYDGLLLDLGVDVTQAGRYRVVADVVGGDGTAVASVSGIATLDPGSRAIRVRAEGRQLFETAADGPYLLRRVVLTHDDDAFTLEDFADELTGTTAYVHSAFEHDAVVLDEAAINEGTPEDIDGDGLFDSIVVNVPVTVDSAGTYHLNGRLTTPAGTSVSEAAGAISLNAGRSTIVLKFPAAAIGAGSFDTTFELRNLVAYRADNVDAFDFVEQSITTARYRSNQMEGYPVSPPRNARWAEDVSVSTSGDASASTSVAVEPTTTNDSTLEGRWDGSVNSTQPVVGYDVDLATDDQFTNIVATRTVSAVDKKVTFTAVDGVQPGNRYWFRSTARSDAGIRSASAPSGGLAVTDQASGPLVAHVPIATAYNGQAIPISMTSTCTAGHDCSARLFWKATPNDADLVGQATAALAQGWHSASLEPAGSTTLSDQEAVTWSGEIPGFDVTTTGVDYFIEAEDHLAVTRVPGGTFVGTPSEPDIDVPDAGYWHIHTVNPPLVTHQPVPFSQADESIPVSIQAACPTNSCEATLYYRTTTGPITDETVVADNGELLATPDWPSTAMERQPGSSVGQAGELVTFTAEIPGGYADTRGVDYFFRVTDGTTQAWSPGSTYQGYYAPVDGMRTGWYHVHVLEPPHVVHAPPTSGAYRADIPVSASSNCPRGRACTARLYFRTTTSDGLNTTSPFESVPMGVLATPFLDGSSLITVTGAIPGRVADTRGVDYFFSVSDGTTTTWWPGTSHVDGYVPVEGTRVGYQHVRVLDPPHVTHTPVGAAPALQDLVIESTVTCATEHCDVALHYQKNVWADVDYPYSIPMTQVGAATNTPVGKLATYRATIPAADVTTTQLAYFIEAFDGYTHGYAPGTSYVGAYVPTDGMHVQSFPVRVLEPPHLVHVPPTTATASQPLSMRADANCATDTCIATIHWRAPGQDWQAATMQPANIEAGVGDLVTYTATIPGTDVVVGLQHWIEVTDGYVSDRTPTWSLQVTTS